MKFASMDNIEDTEKENLRSIDENFHSKSENNIEVELSSQKGYLLSPNENILGSAKGTENAFQGNGLKKYDARENNLKPLRESKNGTKFFSVPEEKHLNQMSLVDSAKLDQNTINKGTVDPVENANHTSSKDALNETHKLVAELKKITSTAYKNDDGLEVTSELENLSENSINLGGLKFNNGESSESINKGIDIGEGSDLAVAANQLFGERRNLLSENLTQSENRYKSVDNNATEDPKRYQIFILANSYEEGRPPIPLQTYRWEEIRRAKQQGGYPWTHLYKQPLGPNEEPEIVLKYKIKDTSFGDDSPKTLKKVRICEPHDICDLPNAETQLSEEENGTKFSEPVKETVGLNNTILQANDWQNENSAQKLKKPIRKKVLETLKIQAVSNTEGSLEESPKESPCCHPLVDKLKIMADKQFSKHNIKKVPLKQNEKIVLEEEQKILQLKVSPKAERGEIPHFVEKQDSDEVIEILELEESPSKTRKRRCDAILHPTDKSVLVPDEIIEISDFHQSRDVQLDCGLNIFDKSMTPPQNQKEHLYEDINNDIANNVNQILEEASIIALKRSLEEQDSATLQKIECKSDMLEQLLDTEEVCGKPSYKCAPISSTESASSDEEKKLSVLPTIVELDLTDNYGLRHSAEKTETGAHVQCEPETEVFSCPEKKVTFYKNDNHDDIHQKGGIMLPECHPSKRWSKMSDHEYEPIGEPCSQVMASDVVEAYEAGVIEEKKEHYLRDGNHISKSTENINAENLHSHDGNINSHVDEREDESCVSSGITSSRPESRADEIHTSQVDSSAIESLPLKTESRKKSFMANAQDKSRRVQQNLRSQAGKLKSKLSGMKKPATGSPKTKEKKKFLGTDFAKVKLDLKKPEFPKLKAPDMSKFQKFKAPDMSKFHKFKAPDMSKFKSPNFGKIEFKRPEFTKFNKPDLSKFKIPEKFSSLKLRRSRSLKEQTSSVDETAASSMEPSEPYQEKKIFEFHFATYPRILRKKKTKRVTEEEPHVTSDFRRTESPTSTESNNVAVTRSLAKGPVGSNWVDKFSDTSYGDSESGKYQRYDSEPENGGSTEKVHRNMDLHPEDYDRSSQILTHLENMHSDEMKQLAAYDEENRAIHEISKIREGEFKMRKPMIHQDSDLVSEESKDFGWTEKDVLEHNILSRSETDFEKTSGDLKNFINEDQKSNSIENTNPDTQSTASSNAFRRKGVLEEIDDDEFFLRKKGISEENIQIREYISSAIREGLSGGENALVHISNEPYYSNKPSASDEVVNYAYDVPPSKPKRIKGSVSNAFEDLRQESSQFSNTVGTSESSEKPNRPSRKPKPKKQMEMPFIEKDLPYFEEEHLSDNEYDVPRNNSPVRDVMQKNTHELPKNDPPQAPKRRKKHSDKTIQETDLNGFVENPALNHFSPEDSEREIVVYRTEHEYIIPLAQIETFSSTPIPAPRRSRSRSRSQTSHFADDDHISYGAESVNSDLVFTDNTKNEIEIKEGDGYAIIKRDPPPRPPAPTRRKKSSSSLEEKRFSTLPFSRKSFDRLDPLIVNGDESNKLSEGRSVSSLEGVLSRKIEITNGMQYEYEELDNDEIHTNDFSKKLQSGDIVNKMKYRPLPPPPRPPRESRKNKEEKQKCLDTRTTDVEESTQVCNEKLFVEVEVSTQTDPLPDDFECEEFEITDDMRIIEPRKTKTLEDILKQEQEAELERAKQLAEDDALSRSIQKFRESNQRSFSEKSKASTGENVKGSSSRPNTPSAILVERRIPTPLPNQIAVQASLTVQPICECDLNNLSKFEIESDIENDQNDEKKNEPETKENISFQELDLNDPPNPPPRKKTSLDENQSNNNLNRLANLVPNSTTRLTELEVDHLSVRAIEAGKITVSQLEGSSISVQDFECKSGNLTISNFELPPGFIDGIVERIRASEKEYLESLSQKAVQEEPPARPPPPEQHHLPLDYIQVPVNAQSLSQCRQAAENEYQSGIIHKRRRHHRRRDSSSSDVQKDSRTSKSTRAPEPSISQLSGQLLSACGATALRTVNQILNLLNISEKELNNQNMKIIVIIFIIMTLGFLLMGMAGAKNIHHHHWDYFNPPGNTRN